MSNINIQDFIKTQWAKIPKDMQDAIGSSKWTEKLTEIGEKRNLRVDELGKIEKEIIILFVGATHAGDFYSNIKDSLKWDDQKTTDVVNDINTEILTKINQAVISKEGPQTQQKEKEFTPEEKEYMESLKDDEYNTKLPSEEEAIMVERYKTLPKQIQDVLSDPKLPEKIKMIGERNNAKENKDLSAIENEITLILLGATDKAELIKNLKERGGFKDEIAGKIAINIKREIIDPIQQYLENPVINSAYPSSSASSQQADLKTNETIKTGMIESKLSGAFRIPINKKEDIRKIPTLSNSKNTSATDPYREKPQ